MAEEDGDDDDDYGGRDLTMTINPHAENRNRGEIRIVLGC